MGLINESTGNMDEAFDFYKQNLEKNPECTLTLNRLGRIYLKKRLFDEAQECFKKVLSYDNRNSEARFLYAAAEKGRGNIAGARRLMMDIPYGEGYYNPSVIELAKLDMLLGYYEEAVMMLESCKERGDSYIDFLLSICMKKEGFPDKSQEILKECKNVNEYILAERYLQNPYETGRSSFISYTGGDGRVIIPIAIQYIELNLLQEAGNLLSLVNKPDIKVHLLLMYIDSKLNNKKGITLKGVLEDSLDYVFVNEHYIAKLLEDNRSNDESGKVEYLLGNYYYWIGRKDEALECFLSAYDKGLRYTVLLRNIGYTYFNYKRDMDLAERYFHEDIEVNDGRNEDSINYLNRIYKEKDDLEGRRKLLPYMEKTHNKTLVLTQMAEILKDIGEEDKAIEIMSSQEIENWEGFETSGSLYREIVIGMAEKELRAGNIAEAVRLIDNARNYPTKLNYGEPSKFIILSDYYYCKGIVYSAAGREKEAMEAFKKGAAELDNPRLSNRDKSRKYAMKCIEQIQRRQ
jgi:tetratricopeptide (TPR) repeat protein